MITRSPVKPTKPPSGVHARRAPTPLRSTPVATATTSILTSSTATGSTATPHEAMVASQLAHINELVQKNRSLEQTVKKLNEDLSKSAADIVTLNAERKSWDGDRKTWMGERQKWMDERKTWAEGCDTMQACHRVQQYRVACALHDERVAVLKMQEAARQEQVKRLQRDYKITMFQAREAELETQIEQVEELRDEAVEVKAYYEKSTQELKARSAVLADEVKSKTAEIQAAHRQRERAEVRSSLEYHCRFCHETPITFLGRSPAPSRGSCGRNGNVHGDNLQARSSHHRTRCSGCSSYVPQAFPRACSGRNYPTSHPTY